MLHTSSQTEKREGGEKKDPKQSIIEGQSVRGVGKRGLEEG